MCTCGERNRNSVPMVHLSLNFKSAMSFGRNRNHKVVMMASKRYKSQREALFAFQCLMPKGFKKCTTLSSSHHRQKGTNLGKGLAGLEVGGAQ